MFEISLLKVHKKHVKVFFGKCYNNFTKTNIFGVSDLKILKKKQKNCFVCV